MTYQRDCNFHYNSSYLELDALVRSFPVQVWRDRVAEEGLIFNVEVLYYMQKEYYRVCADCWRSAMLRMLERTGM